jgi:hypothetical protein
MLNAAGARTPPPPDDGEHPIITLATRNDIVNSINRRHLNELVGREQTANAEISGDFGRGDASYPADAELKDVVTVVRADEAHHRDANHYASVRTRPTFCMNS